MRPDSVRLDSIFDCCDLVSSLYFSLSLTFFLSQKRTDRRKRRKGKLPEDPSLDTTSLVDSSVSDTGIFAALGATSSASLTSTSIAAQGFGTAPPTVGFGVPSFSTTSSTSVMKVNAPSLGFVAKINTAAPAVGSRIVGLGRSES